MAMKFYRTNVMQVIKYQKRASHGDAALIEPDCIKPARENYTLNGAMTCGAHRLLAEGKVFAVDQLLTGSKAADVLASEFLSAYRVGESEVRDW